MEWIRVMWNLISKFFGPLALVIAIVFAVKECRRADRAVALYKNNQNNVKLAAEILDQVIDEETGREYTTYTPNLIPQEALSDPVHEDLHNLLDSVEDELKTLLKERDIDKRKIREYESINANLKAKLKGTAKDTVIVYKDNTIQWVYNPADTVLDLEVDLQTKTLSYWDGRSILGINIGTQNIYSTVWWNDPRVRINSIDHILVSSPLPKNKFLLSGKSEYRFNANQLWIGSEAELKMDRVGVYGNYMYSPSNENHEKAVGLKYYLFK